MKKVDPTIPTEAVIQASQLRNKKQIMDAMKGGDDPQAAQMKMLEMEVTLKDAMAKIDKLISEAEKNRAITEKTIVETALLPAKAAQDAQLERERMNQSDNHALLNAAQKSQSDQLRIQNQQRPASNGGASV
jgi:hypothetical protein